jgi:hypothetical protein
VRWRFVAAYLGERAVLAGPGKGSLPKPLWRTENIGTFAKHIEYREAAEELIVINGRLPIQKTGCTTIVMHLVFCRGVITSNIRKSCPKSALRLLLQLP